MSKLVASEVIRELAASYRVTLRYLSGASWELVSGVVDALDEAVAALETMESHESSR